MENQIIKQLEKIKKVLEVVKISIIEIRLQGREYNPREWDKIIDRYLSYEDVQFYHCKPYGGFDYERYFVCYKIDGINYFASVCYSSALSSTGFCQISIDKNGEVFRILASNGTKMGHIANCTANKQFMRVNSKNFGTIYSNEF